MKVVILFISQVFPAQVLSDITEVASQNRAAVILHFVSYMYVGARVAHGLDTLAKIQ